MSTPSKQTNLLKSLSLVLAIFNILFAIAAALAIISGLLLLVNKDSTFFAEADAAAAARIQATYAPMTLFFRLASAVAYATIAFFCFKNRSALPNQPEKVVSLPYLIGLIVVPTMLLFNLFTNGGSLPASAWISPLVFLALHAFCFKLTKNLQVS